MGPDAPPSGAGLRLAVRAELVVPESVERGLVERLSAHDLPADALELDEERLLDIELSPVRPLSAGAVHGNEMAVVGHGPEELDAVRPTRELGRTRKATIASRPACVPR